MERVENKEIVSYFYDSFEEYEKHYKEMLGLGYVPSGGSGEPSLHPNKELSSYCMEYKRDIVAPNIDNECPFCKDYAKHLDDEAYFREKRPNPDYDGCYEVALVHQSFYNGYPTGKCSYYGYALNYCPVCGKKIVD